MINRDDTLKLLNSIRNQINKLTKRQERLEERLAHLDDNDSGRYALEQKLHWINLQLPAARLEEGRLFTHLFLSRFQEGHLSFRHPEFDRGYDTEGELSVLLDDDTILTLDVVVYQGSESLRQNRPPYELTHRQIAHVSADKLESVDDLREAVLAWAETTLGRRDVTFTEWY